MIICLCGSTRFREAFDVANMNLSLRGHVVISVGMFGHSDYPSGARHLIGDGSQANPIKSSLDELHYRKINLSDAVYVINVGDYIGYSTQNEISYAKEIGRKVIYMFEHNESEAV